MKNVFRTVFILGSLFSCATGFSADPEVRARSEVLNALAADQETLNEHLFIAAEQGNVDAVDRLIAAGAAIYAQNSDGETPLFKAVLHEHPAVVEKLIAAHADVDVQDNGGYTPLILAARNGNVTIINQLLKADANTNLTAHYQADDDALVAAIKEGKLDAVKALIKGGAEIGEDHLFAAADQASDSGNRAILVQILKAGVGLDAIDNVANELCDNDKCDLAKFIRDTEAVRKWETEQATGGVPVAHFLRLREIERTPTAARRVPARAKRRRATRKKE